MEVLMTERQVATILSVSMACLRKWRLEKRGPGWVKIEGRLVRYRESDIASWLEAGGRRGAHAA